MHTVSDKNLLNHLFTDDGVSFKEQLTNKQKGKNLLQLITAKTFHL